jgi:amidase
MEPREYADHDAVGLRALITSGQVTAAEVEHAARRALETANERVNGLALPPFDPALGHADDGPLAGVPFLIKDSGPMAEGVPFSMGSRALVGVCAPRDTELMTRLRAAGLVTLGLTTVSELVLSFATESARYGVTRNPWNPDRGAGGSSGGAAALVAAGAVPLAHANDGAGSIRIPASACGLVGLKPSRGRTPCGPDQGEAGFGMACEGGLARTVRDVARYLDAIRGPAVGDKYTAPPPPRPYEEELGADPPRLRVAVTARSWSGGEVDPEVAEAVARTGRLLEEMGHAVAEASPRVDWDAVLTTIATETTAIAAPLLAAPRRPDPERMEPLSRRVLRRARELSALDLIAGLDAQNRLTRAAGAFFTAYDLLVTPTLARLPAPHGALGHSAETVEGHLRAEFDYGPFTALFNISGQPAVSLPLAQSRDGLPIGVQLVAAYGREDLLFRLAARLEEAVPWHGRVPPGGLRR